MLLAAVLLVRGSASVRASWYLRMRCRARRAGRRVALTFDDGPDLQRTPAVLDLLARQGVRATFFVVGARAEAHPELVRRMVAEGHVVGNHSYTHSWRFPLRSLGRTMEELRRTGEVLHRITGRQPRLFRPPFGVTNPTIARAVRRLGLDPVGWSIRSLDTMGQSPERVAARILRRLHPGAVILLHDRCAGSERLVGLLVEGLRSRGLEPVTLPELFDIEAYEKTR
ncbi:MAG TPA: polysaccharide deacetylase family protein [Candidatus Alistipes excrementigallinarum]|nr:polysaccharide deacetylase family protein [Candidatus Alistipes excrementigallinarum]